MKYLGKKKRVSYSLKGSGALDIIKNDYAGRNYAVTLQCNEFTALCPVTNQPDFATITIIYVPSLFLVESKSMKLYLMAFRNTGMFHEFIVNKIADDLQKSLKPKYLQVTGHFNSRGGIAISVMAKRGNRKPYECYLSG